MGPGSVGVLAQVLAAVCDPGDEVVFAWRSFEAYPILATLAGARPVPVPLREDEGHDLAAMAAAVTARTRAVLVCSPNNPTGVGVDADEFEDLLRRVPAHVLVVVDEAYLEYAGGAGPDSLALRRRHRNLCVLRTFSKAHGLAGLRVGYALAPRELAEGLRRVALPFGVSAPGPARGDRLPRRRGRGARARRRRHRRTLPRHRAVARGRLGGAGLAGELRLAAGRRRPARAPAGGVRRRRRAGARATPATASGSPWPTGPPTTGCSPSSPPRRCGRERSRGRCAPRSPAHPHRGRRGDRGRDVPRLVRVVPAAQHLRRDRRDGGAQPAAQLRRRPSPSGCSSRW